MDITGQKNNILDTHLLTPPMKLSGGISMLQLADITAQNGWCCESHVQFCTEIVLILEGKVQMMSNSHCFTMQCGQMAIIPEGVLHEVNFTGSERSRMQLVGLHFREDADPCFENLLNAKDSGAIVIDYSPNIKSLFEMLINEYFAQEMRSVQCIQSLLYLILTKTCRQMVSQPGKMPDDVFIETETNDELTLQICRYVRDHSAEMESLNELSKVFMYSYSHLSHHFKRESGYSLKDYWEHYRFQNVIQLMRNETLTLTEIAERAHFQSIHTFSRSFRMKFGVSPSEFRARMKE